MIATTHDYITVRAPDFVRDKRGTPWVDDPVERTATGRRKRVRFSRISSYGTRIDDHALIVAAEMRYLLTGTARLSPLERAVLADFDPTTNGAASQLDSAVSTVLAEAGARRAAERGTWLHSVLECIDRRGPITDELYREAGRYGFTVLDVDRFERRWFERFERAGLEILVVEHPCVDDEFRVAGTLDRIARLHRPLAFGDVVVEAGTVVVVDLKTSMLRLADGHPSYWSPYTCQLALYAASQPYFVSDHGRDLRGLWPWDIDQHHGLIAHVNLEPTEGTVGAVRLWHADLDAGIECAVLARAARQFTARRDLFRSAD